LHLVLDVDVIDTGADAGAPEYVEWYGALG
jgi:uncharacterized YccA/Bax inhibitor family protein